MKTVILGFTIQNGRVNDYFIKIINEFIKCSYKVIIITDGRREDIVDKQSNPMILTWPSKRPTKFKDALFFYQLVKEYKPEIVIGNFSAVNIMTLVGLVCKVPKRVAWIRTLSTQIDNSSFFKRIRKKIVYEMATDLITNSQAMKKDCIACYNINESKVKVFLNGIQLSKSTLVDRDLNQIVYVGRLHFSKGVDILIEAFSAVVSKHTNMKLKIIGSGEEEKNLKELTLNLGLDRHIEFLGSLSKTEVLSSFASANFAVVPSRSEAFGWVVIEAMSVYTPVVGSFTGGITEIIRDNEDGMFFHNNNSSELGEKMIKMLDDQTLVETMRFKAFSRVEEKFNVDGIAENFVQYVLTDQVK